MLHDIVDDPGRATEADLLAAHADQLAAAIATVGVEATAEAAGLSKDRVVAIVGGDEDAVAELDLEAAAAVLAAVDGTLSADAIAAEAREDLLFGMTAGVLNVDVVAADASVDVDPREVQAMVEGRQPMTLREYVALQQLIASRAS